MTILMTGGKPDKTLALPENQSVATDPVADHLSVANPPHQFNNNLPQVIFEIMLN